MCLDLHEILRTAQEAIVSAKKCSCIACPCQGWESLPIVFPVSQLIKLGELGSSSKEEPSVMEYHPEGTHYWSPNAPIALRFFPYNRCSIWQCTQCGRCYLRYTEHGGYYIDHRIRMLNPELVIDLPPISETIVRAEHVMLHPQQGLTGFQAMSVDS